MMEYHEEMKKHIEVGSDHKYLSMTTGKYLPIQRKQRYELVHEPKKKKTTQHNFYRQRVSNQNNNGLWNSSST